MLVNSQTSRMFKMIHAIQADTLLKWASLTPSEMRSHQAVRSLHVVSSVLSLVSNLPLGAKICSALSLPTISIFASLSLTTTLTIFIAAIAFNFATSALVQQDVQWIETLARQRGPEQIRTSGAAAELWSTSQKMTKIFDLIPVDAAYLTQSLVTYLNPSQENAGDVQRTVENKYGAKFVEAFNAAYAQFTEAEKAHLPENVRTALTELSSLLEPSEERVEHLPQHLLHHFVALNRAKEDPPVEGVGFTLFPEDIERAETFVNAELKTARQQLGLPEDSARDDIWKACSVLNEYFAASLGNERIYTYVHKLMNVVQCFDGLKEASNPDGVQNSSVCLINQNQLREWQSAISDLAASKAAVGLTLNVGSLDEAPKLFFGQVAQLSPVAPEVASTADSFATAQ
jgi:hypothetical protein